MKITVRNTKQSADYSMRKVRTSRLLKSILLAGIFVIFTTCDEVDEEQYADEGKQAAKEFCECYKKKSKETCFEQLKSDYDHYTTSAFIDAFNEAVACDVKLEWVATK
jgi:hypothetical protein